MAFRTKQRKQYSMAQPVAKDELDKWTNPMMPEEIQEKVNKRENLPKKQKRLFGK